MQTPNIARSAVAASLVEEPAPPIEVQHLLSRCVANVPLAMAMIDEFESSGAQQFAAIKQSATAGDVEEAAEAAHALKGAAAIIEARSLSALAAQVEATQQDGQASDLLIRVQKLGEEMNRCLSYLPTLREQTRGM